MLLCRIELVDVFAGHWRNGGDDTLRDGLAFEHIDDGRDEVLPVALGEVGDGGFEDGFFVRAGAQVDQGFVGSAQGGSCGIAQEASLLESQGAVYAGQVGVTEAQDVLGIRVSGGPGGDVGDLIAHLFGGDIEDILIRDVDDFLDASGSAFSACLVDGDVGGPDEQELDILGVPALGFGVLAEELAGFLGGFEVVGSESHAAGVGSVVGDAGDAGVLEDAGDQLFGASYPVGEDDAFSALGDEVVGALDGLFLVVGVVAVDDLDAHLLRRLH